MINPEDLAQAYAAGDEAQEWADEDFLSAFENKLTELGYSNIEAQCQCADPDHGHEPQCGWDRAE